MEHWQALALKKQKLLAGFADTSQTEASSEEKKAE
jgi:hypothetical protein